jgi:predicted Fe-Mo cluster-binding NifX family protein
MRVALPIEGDKLSPHFGHCERFAFFDIEEESADIADWHAVAAPEHRPGLLPGWLADLGVTVVIAGGMGPRAVELFRHRGIDVIIGAEEDDPEQAVRSYLKGALATGENVCDHDSNPCNH